MKNNLSKTFKRSVTAVAVTLSLGLTLPAIASDGFVAGHSVTGSGQVLANVEISITNNDTGLTRTATSDADGNFKFPLLPSGVYTMEAKKNGFLVVKQDDLHVKPSGKTNIDLTFETSDVERITVSGSAVSAIDVSSSEANMVVDLNFINKVPVARDVTSIALLAPGTVKGDDDFGDGNNASFGGSSVGENTYYINDINVTNFRNGLGGSELPFEMYESFEVKTGGYSAEFGRSTGGVVNAKTKSGSNEFKWGVSAYFQPSSLRAKAPDTKRTDATDIADTGTEYYDVNSRTDIGENNYNIWASGALIEDKLFFFGLLNQKDTQRDGVDQDAVSTNRMLYGESSETLYAAKIDWYITDDHILELTAWDNGSDLDVEAVEYNHDTKTELSDLGEYVRKRGGSTYGLKYTGILTDDLTISAQYSVNNANYSDLNVGSNPFGDKPAVYERFSNKEFGQYGRTTPTLQEDKRTAYRFDVDWYVHDDHTLRFGIDYEKMEATENTQRAGGVAYRYEDCDSVALANNILDCGKVREEIYLNEGDFETESFAYYIEDTWQVTDNIVARIGLRNESFENYNKSGEKFVDVTDQWAPRLGVSWDIGGEGTTKVFANYGQYYLPVATNTNIRLAGDETYTRQTFAVESINEDYTPNVVAGSEGTLQVFGDGTQKSTGESVNADIEPMYQEEYILGFEHVINDSWSFGVKGTYRKLASSLEDIAIDKGFTDYIEAEFPGETCTQCSGFHYYVLTNPGQDVTITTDPDGDGPVPFDTYTIPADILRYPVAERQYAAVDFTLHRAWDDVWMMNATYTWAHSWGNTEGSVRSDNDQDDAGLTTNFDQPGLTDGANGNLPNDRRHQVKISGSYQVIENLNLGANFNFTTGRPRNSFGYHPTDVFASYYGAESFVKDGELVSRGSEGRTPNTWTLDLSATYNLDWEGNDIMFRADIFNVTNNDKATQLNEINERLDGSDPVTGADFGEHNPTYGLASSYQTPRYVRFSVSATF
ncbi:TonB-dependent receptor [Colwellia sp. RE-S-Sl-9]